MEEEEEEEDEEEEEEEDDGKKYDIEGKLLMYRCVTIEETQCCGG